MSLRYADIRRTIEDHLRLQWHAGSDTLVAWPNDKAPPPAGADWIRPTVLFNENVRTLISTTGTKGQTATGLLIVQIFTPADTGTGQAETYVDELDLLFNEQKINIAAGDPIVFFVSNAQALGNTSPEWHQINFTVPWEHLDR